MEFPKTAQGTFRPADEEDLERDTNGYTNPNLHRRIDPSLQEGEVAEREYIIGVYDSIHSTRYTKLNYHDEESTTCEIP